MTMVAANPQLRRGVGHPLGVVAGGGGHHPLPFAPLLQQGEAVQRPPELKGAGGLEVLQLEIDLPAAEPAQGVGIDQRGVEDCPLSRSWAASMSFRVIGHYFFGLFNRPDCHALNIISIPQKNKGGLLPGKEAAPDQPDYRPNRMESMMRCNLRPVGVEILGFASGP